MKILILGGTGMLGHQLYKHFYKMCRVKITSRRSYETLEKFDIFNPEDVAHVNSLDQNELVPLLVNFKPDVIINAIGLIKQRNTIDHRKKNIEVNALFPHQLQMLGSLFHARIIQFSTDCVFNGKKGQYKLSDPSDAEDIYGKTKYLGELHADNAFTIRSSIIGFELFNKKSLLEWFFAQEGKVNGFCHAIYSGFTTIEMARIIDMIITKHPNKNGLYQIASEAISKFDLLKLINENFQLGLQIKPFKDFYCYRDLCGKRFNEEFNYTPPSWPEMIEKLASENIRGNANG